MRMTTLCLLLAVAAPLLACIEPEHDVAQGGDHDPSRSTAGVGVDFPPAASDQYDAHGVMMLLPTDPERFSWWLSDDPNHEDHFRIDDGDDGAIAQDDGSFLFHPRVGNLASGGQQLTLRLHVSGTRSTESFSDHDELRERGYMTGDPMHELGDQEMTGYWRLSDIVDRGDTISKKIRGGRHSDDHDGMYSACVGLLLSYDGKSNKLWEKELFHPSTPKSSVDKLFDYGDAIAKGQWIGDKITSVRQPDGSVLNTQYIDLDPFDAEGKPDNNWVKVFEYVDDDDAVSWSGKTSTWRIDEVRDVYAKYLSVRSVKAGP
ncbi:MAG: hypothetical protein AB7P03_01130 [Kofleriaceae bacterium]